MAERDPRLQQRPPNHAADMRERPRARVLEFLAHTRTRLAAALVRRRVTLGFVAAAAALVFAQPTWAAWRAGLIIAMVGEFIRVWAAGHLEKGREVTRSGPYRWMRHPLYIGSAIIALGVVIASRSVVVGVLSALYIGATLPAAIRAEEAFLARAFGEAYARYRRGGSSPWEQPMARSFSIERAMRNREYRAVLGLAGGFALLALEIVLSI
jgi:protein-S-isoprenylcysteine O-methyltransferase Ste14